jgi:hypothetical protein
VGVLRSVMRGDLNGCNLVAERNATKNLSRTIVTACLILAEGGVLIKGRVIRFSWRARLHYGGNNNIKFIRRGVTRFDLHLHGVRLKPPPSPINNSALRYVLTTVHSKPALNKHVPHHYSHPWFLFLHPLPTTQNG